MNYIDWPVAIAMVVWPDGRHDSAVRDHLNMGATGSRLWLFLSMDNEGDTVGVMSTSDAAALLADACLRSIIRAEGRPEPFATPEAIPANAWRGGKVRLTNHNDGTCDLGPANNHSVTWFHDVHLCEADLVAFANEHRAIWLLQGRWADATDRQARAFKKAADAVRQSFTDKGVPRCGVCLRGIVAAIGDGLDQLLDGMMEAQKAEGQTDAAALDVARSAMLAFIEHGERAALAYLAYAQQGKREDAAHTALDKLLDAQRQRVTTAIAGCKAPVGALTVEPARCGKRGPIGAVEEYTALHLERRRAGIHSLTKGHEATKIWHILKTDPKYAHLRRVPGQKYLAEQLTRFYS